MSDRFLGTLGAGIIIGGSIVFVFDHFFFRLPLWFALIGAGLLGFVLAWKLKNA